MDTAPVTLAKHIVWPFSGVIALICGVVSAAPVLVFGLAAPGYLLGPLTLGIVALVTMLIVYWSQVLFSPEGAGELPPLVTCVGMVVGIAATGLFLLLEFEPAHPFVDALLIVLSVAVVILFSMLVLRLWRNVNAPPRPTARIDWSVVATLVLALVA